MRLGFNLVWHRLPHTMAQPVAQLAGGQPPGLEATTCTVYAPVKPLVFEFALTV